MPTTMARATSSSMTSSFTLTPHLADHSPDKREAAARLRTRFDIRTGSGRPSDAHCLVEDALHRIRTLNTNVNSADELDCPTKNPGSSGAPFSREMLCTVLRTQAMFFLFSGFADGYPYRAALGQSAVKRR
jgi:hypothetical protein